jgi:probable phosphoglycerate mutase
VSNSFIIEADGGSRGNPGPAGSGAVVIDAQTGEIVAEIAEFIGIATNNVAEYRAIRAGLEQALRLDESASIRVRMDSKLVVEQLSGNWKIKHPDMRALAIEVQSLIHGRDVSFEWIPRELNVRADALANKAMDEEASSLRLLGDLPKTNDAPASVQFESVAPAITPGAAEFNMASPSSIRAPRVSELAPTTVVLIRHGRTSLTEGNRISGRGGADPALSANGRTDAEAVARLLADFGVTGPYEHIKPLQAIYSSPIRRTVETATAISARVGQSVVIEDGFAEISFGDWDGLRHDEAQARDQDLFESWRGSWTIAPPNGESLQVFDERVIASLQKCIAAHPGQTIGIVAHVMPIRGIIRKAIGAAKDAYWSIQVAPCSVSILRFWGSEAAEVITINSTSHF